MKKAIKQKLVVSSCCFCLISILSLIGCSPAYAQENVGSQMLDTTRICSITFKADIGEEISENSTAQVHLYKIADLTDNYHARLLSPYSDFISDADDLFPRTLSMQFQISLELSETINKNNIQPFKSQQFEQNGTTCFSNLTTGIYFAMIDDIEERYIYEFSPNLIILPSPVKTSPGELLYDFPIDLKAIIKERPSFTSKTIKVEWYDDVTPNEEYGITADYFSKYRPDFNNILLVYRNEETQMTWCLDEEGNYGGEEYSISLSPENNYSVQLEGLSNKVEWGLSSEGGTHETPDGYFIGSTICDYSKYGEDENFSWGFPYGIEPFVECVPIGDTFVLRYYASYEHYEASKMEAATLEIPSTFSVARRQVRAPEQTFSFDITLSDTTGTYPIITPPGDVIGWITNGTGSFELEPFQTFSVVGLPDGVTYELTERSQEGWTIADQRGGQGTVVDGYTQLATTTNVEDHTDPVLNSPLPETGGKGTATIIAAGVLFLMTGMGMWSVSMAKSQSIKRRKAGLEYGTMETTHR